MAAVSRNVLTFAENDASVRRNRLYSAFVHLLRLKHSRGFGIQSPSAYAFYRDVVFERLPYYAYSRLTQFIDPQLSEASCRLLFRIANFASPTTVIDVFALSPAPVCHMAAASSRSKAVLVSPSAGCGRQEIACAIAEGFDIETMPGIDSAAASRLCSEGSIMAHINAINDADSVQRIVGTLLPFMHGQSILVVDGINRRPIKHIWRQACQAQHASAAFDLFDIGILMFDANCNKRYYKLNY